MFLDHCHWLRTCTGFLAGLSEKDAVCLSKLVLIFQATLAVLLFFGLEETLYSRSYPTPAQALSSESPLEVIRGSDAASIRMKSYWQTHPIHSRGTNCHEAWCELFVRPFHLVFLPPVLWAGMFTGVSVCWWAAIFTTESQFFTGPPYNWDGTQVGLSNTAALIGSLLGTIFAGNASDKFVLAVAKANHGIREPEHRLVLLAATAIVTSGGLVLYGMGVEVGLPWICPVLGMGLMAFGFTASSIIGEVRSPPIHDRPTLIHEQTYALDSYRAVAAESLVLVNVFRNLIGMTFVFCIQPWLAHSGYGNAYIQMMVMGLIMHLTVIPVVIWGKRMRAMTTERYLDMVDKSGVPREFA